MHRRRRDPGPGKPSRTAAVRRRFLHGFGAPSAAPKGAARCVRRGYRRFPAVAWIVQKSGRLLFLNADPRRVHMKKKPLAALALVSAFVAGPALAQEVSANFSLTSNYKFRGQDQTDNDPAVQGGFDFEYQGFYLGNWNSSIGFTDAGIEMDFYGGYKGEFGDGFGYDVGLLQYYYPGDTDLNTTELYAGLSWGPFGLKYSHTVSSKYFGAEDGRGTGYLNLTFDYPLIESLTLNAAVGYSALTDELNDAGMPDYTDYKLGVTYDLGQGFSLGGHVVGGTKKSDYDPINKTRFILTISKAM
jgi:uncharacterized protein (TIGR02001 family)